MQLAPAVATPKVRSTGCRCAIREQHRLRVDISQVCSPGTRATLAIDLVGNPPGRQLDGDHRLRCGHLHRVLCLVIRSVMHGHCLELLHALGPVEIGDDVDGDGNSLMSCVADSGSSRHSLFSMAQPTSGQFTREDIESHQHWVAHQQP